MQFSTSYLEWLTYHIFVDLDWDKSGMIGKAEFMHLLSRINVYIKRELANKMFHDAVSENVRSRNPEISFNQCIDIIRKIKPSLIVSLDQERKKFLLLSSWKSFYTIRKRSTMPPLKT